MSGTEEVSDELLFAYVDGELDAAAAAQLESAMAQDTSLAARVAQQRHLRRLLQGSFDPVMQEPVPDRLLQAMTPAPAVDILAARARKSAGGARRWAWPEWGALAATLVLGLVAGHNFQDPAGEQPVVVQEGGLVASGSLDRALSTQPGGTVDASGAQIGLSIQTTSGEYCRSFNLGMFSGLACRRGQDWVIDTLAATAASPGQGEFRQATSFLPEAVRITIEQRMSGEPLTEAEEAEQLEARWRTAPRPASPR